MSKDKQCSQSAELNEWISESCRICLVNRDDLEELRPALILRLRRCTGVTLRSPDIPRLICPKCTEELEISYRFRIKCLRAERTLQMRPKPSAEIPPEKDKSNDDIIDDYTDCEDKSSTATAIDDLSEQFKCDTCNLRCQSKWVLKIHMRTHSGERPFQCELCHKRFVSNSNMKMHKKLTHSNNTQVCSECGKSFSCLTYLKRHQIIHSKVKPHACTLCDKRFTSKCYLKEHIARHKGDKRFFCEVCGLKFISVVNLKQHMSVHGIQNRNYKKHRCTLCDYKTMGRVDLERHIRKHTGEKPFRCPHDGCQSTFVGKASLKIHMRIHTGEKPYGCSACSAKFYRGDKLKNHLLKKHNIVGASPDKRSRLNQPIESK